MQRGDNLEMSQREGKFNANFSGKQHNPTVHILCRKHYALHQDLAKNMNKNFHGYIKNIVNLPSNICTKFVNIWGIENTNFLSSKKDYR